MRIFCSNQIDRLVELLFQELFSLENHFLTHRWVVVSNDQVRRDLLLRFSNFLKDFSLENLTFLDYDQLLACIYPKISSKIELSLKIQRGLDQLSHEPLIAGLDWYWVNTPFQKRAFICHQIADLFIKYMDQSESSFKKWISSNGWQQLLWKNIFDDLMPWDDLNPLSGELYLFALQPLPIYRFETFRKLGATCFLFSPSSVYWADFLTDREQVRFLDHALVGQKVELSRYFQEHHPLLANWGIAGRRIMEWLVDQEYREFYFVPQGNSLLADLQREILNLIPMNSWEVGDKSIQIHETPSPICEVEVAWELIQKLGIASQNILIVATDLDLYAPIIETVFQQRGFSLRCDYFGISVERSDPLIRGYKTLLSLNQFRYAREWMERLFSSAPFMKRFELSAEDIDILRIWWKQAHIHYELRGTHQGSWEAGIKRLFLALHTSNSGIQITDSHLNLLDKLVNIIHLLEEKLSFVTEALFLSISEWSDLLISLLTTFFAIDGCSSYLIDELAKLNLLKIDALFSFSSIEPILEEIQHRKVGAVHSQSPDAIRVVSIENSSFISSELVIILGMGFSQFPRSDLFVFPEDRDRDAYLFLEALSNAREYFIVTYSNIKNDLTEKASRLVDQLRRHSPAISFFSHSPSFLFNVSKVGKEVSPSISVKKTFFSLNEESLLSFKKKDISHASFLSSLKKGVNGSEVFLPTSSLRRLANYPVHFFFEERCNIRLKEEEGGDEFSLSHIEMANIRRESLDKPLTEIFRKKEEEGIIPPYFFGAAIRFNIEKEIDKYHDMLRKLGIDFESIYSVELDRFCSSPYQLDKRRWVYPSFSLPLSAKRNLLIQGKIGDFCPYGLLFHGKNSLSDLVRVWPFYLVSLQLPFFSDCRQICWTKQGTVRNLPVSDVEELFIRYLSYLDSSLLFPSPLLPRWSRSILLDGKIPISDHSEDQLGWFLSQDLLPPFSFWLKIWIPYLRELFNEII